MDATSTRVQARDRNLSPDVFAFEDEDDDEKYQRPLLNSDPWSLIPFFVLCPFVFLAPDPYCHSPAPLPVFPVFTGLCRTKT
jgi:hypothetical protein